MKKFAIIAISLLTVLAFSQNSYSRSLYRTYEITEIQEHSITMRDADGKVTVIDKEPGDLKVGDFVRYDKNRKRLKKSSWQPATIVEITRNTITVEPRNGGRHEIDKLNMYRGEFSPGEKVFFKESTGQLKKGDFQDQDEE